MTAEEMKKEFYALYDKMASSKNVSYMRTFGNVHKEMMEWMIQNKPELAQEWLDKLEAVKWKNYVTPKEAESIVAKMEPKAPWSREQWRQAMERYKYELEKEPCFNRCALWVTMDMIMSDSSDTLRKYISEEDLFGVVYDLAVDKLTDADGRFMIRNYFDV